MKLKLLYRGPSNNTNAGIVVVVDSQKDKIGKDNCGKGYSVFA